jgi:hypothetical protein
MLVVMAIYCFLFSFNPTLLRDTRVNDREIVIERKREREREKKQNNSFNYI